jgi:predicted ATP-dependent endonuclease of OLD family
MIKQISIYGYKSLKKFKMGFEPGVNIIVGDNDVGKTSILEAINLVLTGQLSGKSIFSEISPYIFNSDIVTEFIKNIGKPDAFPPRIVIEAIFYENDQTARLKGINNTSREDVPGISLSIDLDPQYSEEFKHYIQTPSEVISVPTEFYSVSWLYFNGNAVGGRGNLLKSTYIDASSIRFSSSSDKFINKVVNDTLSDKDRAMLSLEYRKLRHSFSEIEEVKSINKGLSEKGKAVATGEFKVSVDISSKSAWDSVLIPYLDEIPFHFLGMGKQSKLKIGFALSATVEKTTVFLIEEPENHLSFSNMNILMDRISTLCKDRQAIISTHSNFVLNKLGIDRLHLMKNQSVLTLSKLTPSTVSYFKRLPGYDTLRILLAKKVILVEGPTEELVLQRAYFDKYGMLPLAKGVDIISVRGLAFKRFLEISQKLNIETIVVTDNDGAPEKVVEKYKDFATVACIKLLYPVDPKLSTFEIAMASRNSLDIFNKVLATSYTSESELLAYLLNNKTEWALKALEATEKLDYPEYIKNAIE